MTARVDAYTVPGARHRELTATLSALAGLLGCGLEWPGLPDERRPDVCRSSPHGRRLFLGEAKASERPSDGASKVRLARYLTWGLAHLARGGELVVALACDVEDLPGWSRELHRLCADWDGYTREFLVGGEAIAALALGASGGQPEYLDLEWVPSRGPVLRHPRPGLA